MSRRPNIEVRERILDAAHRVFLESGLRGSSMEDVARAAGVKKANLFHYYPSKESLELAVFDRVAESLRERVSARFPPLANDPMSAVAAMFDDARAHFEGVTPCGGCFLGKVAQEGECLHDALRDRVRALFAFWTSSLSTVLENGQQQGLLRKDLAPPDAAEALVGLLEGGLLMSRAMGQVGPLRSARQLALSYLGSLRLEPTRTHLIP